MEIRQLEALNAVVASGSVTAAARMLGRSQPVVSRQISDLESELGFTLFERTRPAITMTPRGTEFYQDARCILADFQQLESRALDVRDGQIRPLRMLVAADLAHGLLPEALAHIDRFTMAFRQKIVIEEVVHETTAGTIMESRVDFAFVNLPVDGEGLQVHWCGQAPCLLAMAAGHPLAAQDVVRLEDLGDADVITLLGRYRMRYHLTQSLVRATADRSRRHIEVGSQQTALSMVRTGLGVALMDPFSLRGALLDGITLRPVTAEIPYRVGVVSQATHEVPEAAAYLIRGLHAYVQDTVPRYADTDHNGLPLRLHARGSSGPHAAHTRNCGITPDR